jgi:hypothetical protein
VVNGSSQTLFVNGVAAITTTYNFTEWNTSGNLYIGASPAFNEYFSGYIDDVRISKNAARYAVNFAVPTKAFL